MNLDEYILGPPGTGKTTALISRVTDALDNGIPPDRIGLLTFTKNAAEVAKARIAEAFPGQKFPYIRTIHSLTFGELGLDRKQTIQTKDTLAIADSIALKMKANDQAPHEEGDRVFQVLHLAAAMRCSLEEAAMHDGGSGVDFQKVLMASQALADYKNQTGKIDYMDMLSDFIAQGHTPPLDLLLVDECQDLSKIQWDLIDMFDCPKIFAGDDDQSIYQWAGADVHDYLRRIRTGRQTILGTSYRLPRTVWHEANKVIQQVHDRVHKKWKPKDEEGQFLAVPSEFIPGFTREGSYMVIGLFHFQLRHIRKRLKQEGTWFEESNGKSSIPMPLVKAHTDWEHFRETGEIGPELVPFCRKFMSVDTLRYFFFEKQNRKAGLRPIQDLLYFAKPKTIRDQDVTYYRAALAQVQKNKRPRIRLSTVHKAKGDEADHVLLCAPSSKRARQMNHGTRDELIRLVYVAMTRARHNLYVTRGVNFGEGHDEP